MKRLISWVRKILFTKKTKETPVDPQLKKKAEIITQLRQLALLLSNIEKTLPNRRARKQFRRQLIKDDRVSGELIQSLINQYEK